MGTDRKNLRARLSTRERVVLWLILFAIRILAPWEYDHQFAEVIKEIVSLLGGTNEEDA